MFNLIHILNELDYRYLINMESFPEKYRYLLDENDLPKEYPVENLSPIIDDILYEFEKLRGDRFYTSFMEEKHWEFQNKAKLKALEALEMIIRCKDLDSAIAIIDQWKFPIKTYQDVIREHNSITQRLQIKAMKEYGKEHVKQSYGAMIADINHYTGVELNNKTTVAAYCRHEKIMKDIIAERNKKKSK